MNPETEIKKFDEKLAILREGYLDAKPERKQHWIDKINEELDKMNEELDKRKKLKKP